MRMGDDVLDVEHLLQMMRLGTDTMMSFARDYHPYEWKGPPDVRKSTSFLASLLVTQEHECECWWVE